MLSKAQEIYYAWDIAHKKSVSDDTRFAGVLSEAKIDLNPHQIEAALFAFKSPLSKGAILADEVGLGKTIEAGIILSELWAENKRNILIIVPASLRNQWNLELMEKFYLPSLILDSSSWNVEKKQMADIPQNIYICSYNFAALHEDELGAHFWDLVLYDEAHKLRNVYKKGNVMANKLRIAFQKDKKLLLTATPLQNNLKELYGLISIIDPEFFSSIDSFDEQYNAISTRDNAIFGELKGRINRIVHRTLRSQVQEYVNFTKRTPLVQEYYPTPQEQQLYQAVSVYLMREGTYGIPKRQRPLLSLLVRKIMSSSAYALGFTLQRLITRLEEYKDTNHMPSLLSCVAADCEGYNEEIELLDNQGDFPMPLPMNGVEKEIEELRTYQKMAFGIESESKAQSLLQALDISFVRNKQLGASRKALIFTESRRTQDFLYQFLQEHGYRDKVICFNGTNDSEEAKQIYRLWCRRYMGTNRISGNLVIDKKQAIVDTFQDDADILIATEAGAEGINLQFCSIVINYDMPWNPQRIEQRIGRCHRYGQSHDVVVVNFINKTNVADCRVYELLQNKFCLFNGVFGSSDEILGAVETIDFEQRLNTIYNTCRTEREIETAFDELRKELDQTIQDRIINTKKSLLENFDEEVIHKLRMRKDQDVELMDQYNQHLWKLTLQILGAKATSIDPNNYSFILAQAISADIPAGQYALNKKIEQGTQLRLGHPLGQYVVHQALTGSALDASLTFDLQSYPFKMVMLEPYKGKSGTACVYRVRAQNQYDSEEQLIICAQTDDGEKLPTKFVQKLLELDCVASSPIDLTVLNTIFATDFAEQLSQYKQALSKRTEEQVCYEIDKYEMWEEDQLTPLEKEITDLDKQNRSLVRQIRREYNATIKMQLLKEHKQTSQLLQHKRQQLYQLQNECQQKVDDMTGRLTAAMQNIIQSSLLFRMKWKLL